MIGSEPLAAIVISTFVLIFQSLSHGKALDDKTAQLIFNASKQYVQNYTERHGILKVLGMREPRLLESLYTAVRFLEEEEMKGLESVEDLEKAYRQKKQRSFQFQKRVKRSGIKVANEKQFLMVLGGPGTGKSTFSRRIGLEALKGKKGQFKHRCIPVLIELKEFRSGEINIEQKISDEFSICGFPEASSFTKKALEEGKLLVLLDGLDEVPTERTDEAIRQIQNFVDRYDKNRFITSCRIAAYRHNFRRFTDVAIAEFDDEQIKAFIENWFGADPSIGQECWQKLEKPENQSAKELTQTPLLLTLICLLFQRARQFPANRATLYEKALRVLLEEWAGEKGIPQEELYKGLDTRLKEALLSEIAYTTFEKGQVFFLRRELANTIQEFLEDVLINVRVDSNAVLRSIETQHGVLVERAEGIYSFSHLTLQEYLTAQYINDHRKIEELITQHLTDVRWREVFIILSGLSYYTLEILSLIESNIIQEDIKSPRLRKLLDLANHEYQDIDINEKPFVKRSITLLALLNFKFSPGIEFVHKFVSDQKIKNKIPEFLKDLRTNFLLSNPKFKLVDLSEEGRYELEKYFYKNSLLIECKQSAIRISSKSWNAIEDRIFTTQLALISFSIPIIKKFLIQLNIKFEIIKEKYFKIKNLPENFGIMSPICILVGIERLTEVDIDDFLKLSLEINSSQEKCGILIYENLSDSVRDRVINVRLKNKFMIVPIPFREIEKSIIENRYQTILGIYIRRYVQRADFYNDVNAISNRFDFFGRMGLLKKIDEELNRHQSIGLFGIRKSGKTSVLYQIELLLRDQPKVRIDLQGYGGSRYGAALFNEILIQLYTLIRERGKNCSPDPERFPEVALAREVSLHFINRVCDFSDALKDLGYKLPILIFLDEMERVLPYEGNSQEKIEEFNACFGALRTLAQDKKKISLLVTDVYPDCNRINHWNIKKMPTNPIFNFFKEVFLPPFSEEETSQMIKGIGKLMKTRFDEPTLSAIHSESGGQPYIARQIASFLVQFTANNDEGFVRWSVANKELKTLLLYHDRLGDYFEKSILDEIRKRSVFKSAEVILKLIGYLSKDSIYVTESSLLKKLKEEMRGDFSRREITKSLNWLINAGILGRQMLKNEKVYDIRIVQLTRWLRLDIVEEETY